MPLTFLGVAWCWVVFRAESIHDISVIWSSLAFLGPPGIESVDPRWALVWLPLGLAHWAAQRQVGVRWWRARSELQCAGLLGVVVAVAIWLYPVHFRPFIYFQF